MKLSILKNKVKELKATDVKLIGEQQQKINEQGRLVKQKEALLLIFENQKSTEQYAQILADINNIK